MAQEILSDPTTPVGLSAEWRRRLDFAFEATCELDAATTVLIGLANDPPPDCFHVYVRGQAIRLRDLARVLMSLVSDADVGADLRENAEVILGIHPSSDGDTLRSNPRA